VTPNRPDALSHLGIARELAAWFRLPLKYPAEKFGGAIDGAAPDSQRADLLQAVRVDAPEDCPLYIAYIIAGVKIGPSPAWMQERLTAVGLRPINNVVDVGNYVMLETGQPLHAFDAARLGGNQIVVRRAADGETITTLDGRKRTLSSRMLVIADGEKPVVIAGIMGGEKSGVSADTTDLVLECAIFKRQTVRWTSRQLALSSDSSYRYERGVDPHSALDAACRAVDLIIETAGGRVVGPVHRVGSDVPWKREIVVTHDYITEKLGFDIPAADMRAAFESLEFGISREEPTVEPARGVAWTVEIPSWREDLDRPIDLVEEVLRLHGTERIPSALVSAPGLVGDDDPAVRFTRRTAEYLVGHDFHECVNYTLRPATEVARWASAPAAAGLALANPFVEDQSHLRSTLVAGLLESLKLNRSRGSDVSRLFENGRVFIESDGQTLECAAVGFVIAELSQDRSWLRREATDFYLTKHHVTALGAAAGIDLTQETIAPVNGADGCWQEGQAAVAGSAAQGWIMSCGLLSLAMLRTLGIEGRVHAGLLAVLPERLKAGGEHRRYADFSHFPAAWRDLALVVDSTVPAAAVRQKLLEAARAAAGSNFAVEHVTVFDVYQGEGLPDGKKSLAFNLVFRSGERTLTDDEVNSVLAKIQQSVAADASMAIRA